MLPIIELNEGAIQPLCFWFADERQYDDVAVRPIHARMAQAAVPVDRLYRQRFLVWFGYNLACAWLMA
jgi:hypothetical protein